MCGLLAFVLGATAHAEDRRLAGDEPELWGLTTDDAFVYWGAGGKLRKVAKTGGEPSTVVPAPGIIEVAAAGPNLYFTTRSGLVRRVAKKGGKVKTLVTEQYAPGPIYGDKSGVYWADHGDVARRSNAAVHRLDLAGHMTTLVASLRGPIYLAIDDAYVYWTSAAPGEIMKVAKTGGDSVTVAFGQQLNGPLAVDDAYVYWTSPGERSKFPEGLVMRVKKTGGAPEVVARDPHGASTIAVDGAFVYWANADGVMAAPKQAAATAVPVSTQASAKQLALDATAIYWTAIDRGLIMSAAKPAAR